MDSKGIPLQKRLTITGQQDENGNFYGKYYMFFACDWREQMAYAVTDDIMSNEWDFGGVLMELRRRQIQTIWRSLTLRARPISSTMTAACRMAVDSGAWLRRED